ncbi:arabinogalactan endo-1,4-beta-galactosidase [Halosquirtibacter xylanolyticus]|uniref:glycoside hydrolase family 53 protein n=1 Tax=Halosquirtibacter xylanolyticus TaxID=3374599 RepID=UPI0037498212|nr:arabinogalactan endo-1,4-beta-galactosidase [Prolixibacteraceae bacterium]
MKNILQYIEDLFCVIKEYLFVVILVSFFLVSCNKNDERNEVDKIVQKPMLIGADLSYVSQLEDNGGSFKTEGGVVDSYQLFSEIGNDIVRLRLWHNPTWSPVAESNNPRSHYSSISQVVNDAVRAKENGMDICLDIHYSDNWADPLHQSPPKAWDNTQSLTELNELIYSYTYSVLNSFKDKTVIPKLIQIGNEINNGIMSTPNLDSFPNVSISDGNWRAQGQLINSAIRSVRDFEKENSCDIDIVLHIADPKNIDWWFTNITQNGAVTDYDIIGFSYYHIWHTEVDFFNLEKLVVDSKRKFKKKVMIMETAYPFTEQNNDNYANIYYKQDPISGFPYSEEGQAEYWKTLLDIMKRANCDGVFYWEPCWITTSMKDQWGTGSSWENCAFFNFNGNANKITQLKIN